MKWRRLDDGASFCEKHQKTFGPLEVCPSCGTEAITVIDQPGAEAAATIVDAPAGTRTSVERERWFTGVANWARRQARSLVNCEIGEGGDQFGGAHAGAKLLAEAIKAERAAAALCAIRERRAYVKQLRDERARLRRGGNR